MIDLNIVDGWVECRTYGSTDVSVFWYVGTSIGWTNKEGLVRTHDCLDADVARDYFNTMKSNQLFFYPNAQHGTKGLLRKRR